MAFGSLEIASIPRTQDYSVMKQNEDNKGAFQQMTLGQQSQKQSEKLTKEVHSSDNADWYTGQYDAKEKGHNEYAGNGGDKRRKKKTDRKSPFSIFSPVSLTVLLIHTTPFSCDPGNHACDGFPDIVMIIHPLLQQVTCLYFQLPVPAC